MSAEKIQGIYKELVYWVADVAPNDWRKVEINMEILTDNNEVANSWVIRCFVGDAMKKVEYQASGAKKAEMRDMFIELNDLFAESGERWTVCDLVVYNTGKYEVNFAYDAPPRLSGDLAAGTQ
ncbi:MAG: antitoxin YezG family protein [Pseudomonadales bacterium]|nr:antitoxin YezG family protein [Pseudomonadales bacterium]